MTDVLVVGGGPVGMLLTCELLQRGVSVRLIDDVREHSAHSRATVVWPRLLELMLHTGITESLIETGHRLDGVRYYSGGRPLGTAWMTKLPDTPFPFAVAIAQSSTEAILERRVRELGGTIDTGVTLVGMQQRPEGSCVDATLSRRDGTLEELQVGWLVGADGAHSPWSQTQRRFRCAEHLWRRRSPAIVRAHVGMQVSEPRYGLLLVGRVVFVTDYPNQHALLAQRPSGAGDISVHGFGRCFDRVTDGWRTSALRPTRCDADIEHHCTG